MRLGFNRLTHVSLTATVDALAGAATAGRDATAGATRAATPNAAAVKTRAAGFGRDASPASVVSATRERGRPPFALEVRPRSSRSARTSNAVRARARARFSDAKRGSRLEN